MTRDPRLYLADIAEACLAIRGFLAGVPRERFVSDDLVRSAVLLKLVIIGEAAARLPDATKASHPDVPWRLIVKFRNVAVHGYFGVDWEIVWATAMLDVPTLHSQLETILRSPQTDEP